jgi:hypothetical protein
MQLQDQHPILGNDAPSGLMVHGQFGSGDSPEALICLD